MRGRVSVDDPQIVTGDGAHQDSLLAAGGGGHGAAEVAGRAGGPFWEHYAKWNWTN